MCCGKNNTLAQLCTVCKNMWKQYSLLNTQYPSVFTDTNNFDIFAYLNEHLAKTQSESVLACARVNI